jgi:hypothetical protein
VTELVQKFFVVDYRFFNRHLVSSSLKCARGFTCVEARAIKGPVLVVTLATRS